MTHSAKTAEVGTESQQDDVLLRVNDLAVEFRTENGPVTVVERSTFQLERGQTVALVGESGSGKSVTSQAIMGLVKRVGGTVHGSIDFDGLDLATAGEDKMRKIRGNQISMIFQEPMTSLNPAFTVGGQIADVVQLHEGLSRKAAWDRAVEMLRLVHIPDPGKRAKSYPHEFSGGMRQRVMIAMALACKPKLLIADEPTTALDVTTQAQILELIKEMREEFGMSVLFITHNLGVVADIAERVLVMYAGQVVESGPVDEVFANPKHPYTEGLLKSVPIPGAAREGDLWVIPGAPPAPGQDWTSCRFTDRCLYASDICRSGEPPLVQIGDRATRCARFEEIELEGVK